MFSFVVIASFPNMQWETVMEQIAKHQSESIKFLFAHHLDDDVAKAKLEGTYSGGLDNADAVLVAVRGELGRMFDPHLSVHDGVATAAVEPTPDTSTQGDGL